MNDGGAIGGPSSSYTVGRPRAFTKAGLLCDPRLLRDTDLDVPLTGDLAMLLAVSCFDETNLLLFIAAVGLNSLDRTFSNDLFVPGSSGGPSGAGCKDITSSGDPSLYILQAYLTGGGTYLPNSAALVGLNNLDDTSFKCLDLTTGTLSKSLMLYAN
jgi:hypothetical protein